MTTENEDRRNVYQYVLDSLALIEERGLGLAEAFAILGSTDYACSKKILELSAIEEDRETAHEMQMLFHEMSVRQAMFHMIANFLKTDLSNKVWFPFLEKDCESLPTVDEVLSNE